MTPAVLRDTVSPAALRLVPDRRRFFLGWVLGIAGVVVPPYLTEFLVRLADGPQPLLLLPVVLVPAAAALLWLRLRRYGVELRPDGVHEQTVLHADRFTPRSGIASLVVLRLIEPRTLRAPRQLFLRDAAGRTVLRMRESDWGAEQLDALRSRIGVPARSVDDPVTVAEVRQQRLVALPWWERLPLVRGLVLAVVLVVAATLLLLPLMSR